MYTLNSEILQELNINSLCLAVMDTADQRCPAPMDKARETATKFHTPLTMFSKCHTIYCGVTLLTDEDLAELGKNMLTK